MGEETRWSRIGRRGFTGGRVMDRKPHQQVNKINGGSNENKVTSFCGFHSEKPNDHICKCSCANACLQRMLSCSVASVWPTMFSAVHVITSPLSSGERLVKVSLLSVSAGSIWKQRMTWWLVNNNHRGYQLASCRSNVTLASLKC